METIEFQNKLTPLQQELLKLGYLKLSKDEIEEVKEYLSDLALRHLSRIATEASIKKGYTQEDFESWLNDENQ